MSTRTKHTLRLVLGVAASIALACAALTGAGCNTTEGVGEDISAAGDAIDEAAENAKD